MPTPRQMHANNDDGCVGCVVYSILFVVVTLMLLACFGVNLPQ